MSLAITKSISFCTTCMNRVSHIKKTLLQNIYDNLDSDVEFVLIDYSSNDGLDEYIKSDLYRYIDEGRLTYYRTENHSNYSMSHSRNLAFKLAKGKILCNIDADNLTGRGFATYLLNQFSKHKNIFMSTHKASWVKNDVLGRIALKAEDFKALGGYDEKMKHYGFDDYDLINRLQMYGLRKLVIDDDKFLKAIPHSNAERILNWTNQTNLDKMLISYISPAKSKIFFLWKDLNCTMGTMVSYNNLKMLDNNTSVFNKYEFGIEEGKWIHGKWTDGKDHISFTSEDSLVIEMIVRAEDRFVTKNGDSFVWSKDLKLIEEAIFFFHQTSNRIIMEENLNTRRFKVNETGYGVDNVYKNFQSKYSVNL